MDSTANMSGPGLLSTCTGRWVITLVFLLANFWLLIHDQMRVVVFALFVALLLAVMLLNRTLGIGLTLAYLILMGDIRRLINLELGPSKFDLLLIVAPVIAVTLAAPVIARLRLTTNLSKCVAALMAVMILEIANPKQGGLTVGIAGAMFYLVPILWFWIGRQHGANDLVHKMLLNVVLPLGLIASLLGLAQTFIGFLPWEQAWIDSGVFNVKVGGAFRAFGFSVSPAEYGRLLLFLAVIILARSISGSKLWAVLLPLPLIGIVLESGRGAVLRVVIAFAVMWAFRRVYSRNFALRFGLAAAVLLCIVYVVASRFSPDSHSPAKGTEALIAHQAGGLSHPMDSQHSTVGAHMMYAGKGLVLGLTNPLGFGLGSTTAATSKVGNGGSDAVGFATELDFTDMFEALGVVGGLIYLVVCLTTFSSAMTFMQTAPRFLGLAVVGILAANLGNWSISGEYSSSALIWFLIGALGRVGDERRTNVAQPVQFEFRQTSSMPVLVSYSK